MTGDTTGASARQHLHVILPVLLVDEVLPTLKDTELRVLLVVLRQTHVAGKEVERCWLTHRELCRRTGRASEAVSAAVDALVQRGMLRVFDAAGKELKTSGERQARTGQRFYQAVTRQNVDKASGGVAGKPKTIEVNKDTYSFRKTGLTNTHSTSTLSQGEKERIEQEKARIRQQLNRLSGSG